MEKHDVAAILLDDSAMSRTGIAVIAGQYGRAAALHQRDAGGIDVGAGHFLRAPAHYLISTLGAAAAKVVGNEKIIVTIVTDDERSLDGTVARIEVRSAGIGLDGIVSLGGVLSGAFRPAAHRVPLLRLCKPGKRSIQADKLDTAPERTETEPAGSFLIDDDVRINGIPQVTACNGTDDTAMILPLVIGRRGIERPVGSDTDGGGILSERGAGIIQIVDTVAEQDIGSPSVSPVPRNGLDRPLRSKVFVKSAISG